MTTGSSTLPRARLVVDLAAVRHNVATLRAAAAPAELMVVVKADGYGHGMVEVARAAREAGAHWLGVAVLEEALALRAAGDEGPLLCWLGTPGEELAPAVAADVELTAYTPDDVAAVVAAAQEVGRTARLQLKIDTGLGRGGATEADWPALVAAALQARQDGHVEVTGIWSHLACSDEPEHPANDAQEAAFRRALAVAEEAGLRPRWRHLANSAAALTRPTSRFDLVRCGLAAYGLSPVPQLQSSAELGLVPAMTATARLALVKRVPPGSGVSYGHTYVTDRETTLGVVPVGYAEGVLRSASGVAPLLAAGRRTTVAGRVCMDQLVVDLGDAPAAAGDEVVLFGPGLTGEPTAEEWARACGTISYEIVTRLGGRFTREHVDSTQEDPAR
ncbi:alanine racemase [Nocardioides caldifontis]|uniref:alanine racemase n=1 Tax=Nocardioides caldifontis TaxID=2588938 RepID=UPI001EEFE2DC|nr:alanine racemase [Nocardioides caldifontis]